MARIWTDNPAGLDTNVAAIGMPNIGTADNPLGTVYATEFVGTNIIGDDVLSVYGAGTAYTLTAVSAAVDMGTTDPVIVINKAGTYLIQARVNYQLVGATFAANRTITTKLRRTNNTAADIANSSTAIGSGVITTITGPLGVIELPAVIYTTTAITDSLTLFADVSVVPTAGSLTITEASIVAVRLY